MLKKIMSAVFGGMVGGTCSVILLDILRVQSLEIAVISGATLTTIGCLGCFSIYLGEDG